MAFDLESYEPVASRIQRFYEAYPNGAIHCEIVHDDGKRVMVKATVWRDINDVQPSAVDFAEEHLSDRGVNATSRVENACTSAIGRAISIAAHGLGPSDVISERPANAPSDKQVWLYKKLLKEAGKLPPLDLASWDKFKISKAIEALKNNEPEEIPLPEEEPF